MANYGGQTLVFELPSQPERVWDALTDQSALNQWFGETNLLARAGLPFSLRPHAGGDLPAGAGEVVAVEPPRRLVLRWRAAGRVLALTILVEPGPGGSVLRVAHSDTGGIDETQSAALRHLYDERLRAFLAGVPLPDRAPVVAPAPRAPHPGVPAPTALPIQDPVRASVPTRRRAVVPAAVGAVAVVVLLLVAWTVAGASFTWGAPGADGSPTAPASPTAATQPDTPSTAAATTVTTTASATPSASLTSGASGPLTVASRVTDRQPNSLTVVVTITNRSDAGQTWRNVGVDLSSANLTLSNVDSRVNYDWAGTRACFTPGPAVTTVAAGGTVTFPFTVTGAVPGDVTATSLNHAACS